ncbi:hypothetical protein N657DRAFT_462400 [Parathielavia appendiculata]|uniref:Uncharacterized protein n=1 Tax=Parathielavia appendiculata TaxID=2587402 RepID=A0AAN6Z3A1_9PEZI|nr:hypothetical protein N657DRAFT_462400 [Parathielavia appendiculata]
MQYLAVTKCRTDTHDGASGRGSHSLAHESRCQPEQLCKVARRVHDLREDRKKPRLPRYMSSRDSTKRRMTVWQHDQRPVHRFLASAPLRKKIHAQMPYYLLRQREYLNTVQMHVSPKVLLVVSSADGTPPATTHLRGPPWLDSCWISTSRTQVGQVVRPARPRTGHLPLAAPHPGAATLFICRCRKEPPPRAQAFGHLTGAHRHRIGTRK